MFEGIVSTSERYMASGFWGPLAEAERDRRRGRGCEQVEALEEGVVLLLDQRSHLLGLAVEGLVVAGRERVGNDACPALRLVAEALVAVLA